MVNIVVDGLTGKADLEPGHYELFGTNASLPWGGPTGIAFDVPAPATAPPVGGAVSGGLARPANQAELQTMLQAAADAGTGVSFDGSLVIPVTGRIDVNLTDTGDFGPTFNFNGMRLVSQNTDGTTAVIRFMGASKFLSISQLNVFGNGHASSGCGNGIEIFSAGGPILLFVLRELVATWCGADGIRIMGDIYEGETYSLRAKDNRGNGCAISSAGGVISNIQMHGNNLSRNRSYGLALEDGASSVDVIGGSHINNNIGGIFAPNGLRTAAFINGENTGEVLISMPGSAYTSTVIGCNLSSAGYPCAPNDPLSKTSMYVIGPVPPANLVQHDNYVTPYGPQAPAGMAVLKP